MPPCIWTACCPMNFAERPIWTLAADIALARSAALSSSALMVAKYIMLRACSSATTMSEARCCRAWNEPIVTPNCLRVFMYSTVMASASDMVVALEQARSMMYFATMSAEDDNAAERARAMSAAKVQIGRSAKFIGQQAVQMHGGIAMTHEYKVGHLFKRLTMIDGAFGDADLHLRRLGDGGSLFA